MAARTAFRRDQPAASASLSARSASLSPRHELRGRRVDPGIALEDQEVVSDALVPLVHGVQRLAAGAASGRRSSVQRPGPGRDGAQPSAQSTRRRARARRGSARRPCGAARRRARRWPRWSSVRGRRSHAGRPSPPRSARASPRAVLRVVSARTCESLHSSVPRKLDSERSALHIIVAQYCATKGERPCSTSISPRSR